MPDPTGFRFMPLNRPGGCSESCVPEGSPEHKLLRGAARSGVGRGQPLLQTAGGRGFLEEKRGGKGREESKRKATRRVQWALAQSCP